MGEIVKNKRFFYIFTLIFIAGFLVFPIISLADEFNDINLYETGKYLELSQGDAQKLIDTLKQVLTREGIFLWGSGGASEEKTAAGVILLNIVRVEILNHLLVDVPIEITWKIIKGAVEISRVFLDPQGVSIVLDKFEKETVKIAVAYGMDFLVGNEIRVTPGASKFKYYSYRGEEKEIVLQYVMIYKPDRNNKRAKVEIRFYMPNSIEAPNAEKYNKGITSIPVPNLKKDLSPFIVEIKGFVEKNEFDNYRWVDENGRLAHPSVNIDFPPEVPDLGIKPLSLWEKYLLKPIETTIKDVEVIITKVTGKSPGLTDIWNEFKKFIEKIKSFAPAGLIDTSQTEQNQPSINKTSELLTVIETVKGLVEARPQQAEESVEESPQQADEAILKELQEIIDDAAEQIDILAQEITELSRAKLEESTELSQVQEEAEEIVEEIKEEEIEELIEEDEIVEESPQQISGDVCWVDVNTASKEELDKISGIGPTLAQRIIDARPFYSLSDLIGVSGIGEATLQKIVNQGCAYVNYVGGGGGGGGGSSYAPPPPEPEESPASSTSSTSTIVKILISEIQIETSTSTDYDFIELYNPTTTDIDISDWQLKKRNSNGNESSIKLLPENSIIPAQGYFLWVNTEYASSTQISADATSSQVLTATNSVALLDKDKNIIDAIAWGVSIFPFVENLPFHQNPGADQSLGRKWSIISENYIDTDNNQEDFEIQIPTPKAKNQNAEPTAPPQSEGPLLTVVINEIAWMGTGVANPADEWIELYNNTDSIIDLDNWSFAWSHGTTSHNITFSTSTGSVTIIPGNGYFLLERSEDDKTISDIAYNQFFTGELNNDGEKLELRNASGVLIDAVDCSSGWFAGTTSNYYASIERINSNASGTDMTNWATNNLITKNGSDADGNIIYGTPKSENSVSKTETEISGAVDYPVLTYFSQPYIVINTLTVPYNHVLNVEPGVVLKFNENAGLEVQGTIKANGEENNKVMFTSSNEPAYWNGIYFSASSTASELNWAEIRYARGSAGEGYPAILIEDSSISISTSTVENYTDRGIKLINSSSTIETTEFLGSGINISEAGIVIENGSPSIKNCSIRNNDRGIFIEILAEGDLPLIERNNFEDNEYPVYASIPNAIFKNNQGTNNTFNGLVLFTNISQDITWYKNDIPYIIGSPQLGWHVGVNAEVVLTIEPGVRIEFGNGSNIEIEGKILAHGTNDEPIIFTAYPNQAPWKRIYFSASSTGSILENVIIEQGGYNSKGQIYVQGSSIEFLNSTSSFAYGISAGIYLENSSSMVDNSYFGNNKIGIRIEGTEPEPQLGNNTFFNNECDIYWPNASTSCGEIATSSPELTVECGCCPY